MVYLPVALPVLVSVPRGRFRGKRLAHFEGHARTRPRAVFEPRDECEWLAAFEELSRQGVFDAEPEFPVALAAYRAALDAARSSTDPRFDPPAEFLPGLSGPPLPAEFWRSADRFPELCTALDWLHEMLGRVVEGVPPVTVAEFEELAAWFHANEDRLRERSQPSGVLDLADGRQTSCTNVRCELARGPRAVGAGRIAEDVRGLRERWSEK